MSQFKIHEPQSGRKYSGKVFLFEKSTILTEIVERENLKYRYQYTNAILGIVKKRRKPKFSLFEGLRENREIELRGALKVVTEWTTILRDIVQVNVIEGGNNLLYIIYYLSNYPISIFY
jgi:hypothetical protein